MDRADLPSVEVLLIALREKHPEAPEALRKGEARRALSAARAALSAGQSAQDPLEASSAAIQSLRTPSLRRVINATGVVLHTNLGRAPSPAGTPLGGYTNLEYDLAAGRRGKRDVHCAPLLERLLGAPAIAVNNNAAAVFLVLRALARGGEVLVSRGELIEIGDGFRIPDILRAAGVRMVEVGTTNRTRIEDYTRAIGPKTRLLLRVHPSNFRISGFTARPNLRELTGLGIPVVEDLGSGALVDLRAYGIDEPMVRESLEAGVSLVTFSGDKLLGGPQAGYIAGREDLVVRVRKDPMYRALRLDKLAIQAMETALRALLFEDWEQLPAVWMLRRTEAELRVAAEALATRIPGAEVIPGHSVAGGGSTPEQTMPAWLVALPGRARPLERRLRQAGIIARIENERVVLDLRTVLPGEEEALLAAIRS